MVLKDSWVLIKVGIFQKVCRYFNLYDKSNNLVLVLYLYDLILIGSSKKLIV